MNSRRNRYLEDRAMRRSDYRGGRDYARGGMRRDMTDMRNPYGSRGGYVSSDRMNRGRDYGMDYEYNYPESTDRRSDYNYSNDYARNGYDYHYQQYREPYRFMDFKGEDYDNEEKEYYEHLKKWIEKLKHKDTRFNVNKEQIIRQSRNMGVKFEDYNEDELYATYLMLLSDFPKVSADYNVYIGLAKQWLEDDDAALKGSEKLCKYLYAIVLDKD